MNKKSFGFGKGFLFGVLVLLVTNFIWGYGSKLTYEHSKKYVESKFGETDVDPDTLSDESVNLAIAKAFQHEYGADSLLITEIGPASTVKESYVAGVRSVEKLKDPNRVKKVKFIKGDKRYRVVVEYSNKDVNMILWTPDESPFTDDGRFTPPALKPDPVPAQPEKKDTTTANNHDVGEPSNGGSDYNNNSDV